MEFQINSAKLTPAKMVAFGQQFPRATSSALNRTAQQAKTKASALVRERYNIRKSDLDRGIRPSRKSTPRSLTASIKASGRRQPLVQFGARGTIPARKGSIGVSVEVVRGRRLNVAGSFMAIMKSAHRGVFVRSGKFGRRGNPKLERIQELSGPSVPQMFYSTKVFDRLKQFVNETLPKNLASAITYMKK